MKDKQSEIKVVAVDLDKTLLNDKYELSPVNRETLHQLKKNGITLIVATGRMLSAVYRCLGESVELFDYVACYNGATIIRVPDKAPVFTNHISPADLDLLMNELDGKQYNIVVFNGDHVEARHVNPDDELLQYYVGRTNAKIVEMNIPCNSGNDAEKVLAYDMAVTKNYQPYELKLEEEALFQKLMVSKAGFRFSIKKTELGYLEVSRNNVNKYQAVGWILKEMGTEFCNLAALGDGFNDMELIANAGIGIAVGNAIVELKAVATFVCDTNDNDGFTDAMKRLDLID